MNKNTTENRFATFTVYACFFLSGAAGLIYEVLWEKYLAIYVGATALAQIIVLATFMGGMAAGNYFIGKIADKTKNPLQVYAFLEIAAGIYSLFFDSLFILSRNIFLWTVKATGLTLTGLTTAKITASVFSILLPSFLLGGTMPAISKHLIRSESNIGPRISILYFLNSIGAFFGCILAGFYLIREYGLQFSIITGATISIVVGLIAFIISRRYSLVGKEETSPNGETTESVKNNSLGPICAFIILLCISISGMVSMVYEITWIRVLSLILGSSTYSFSLMLATFILGLALGGYILSLKRKQSGYQIIFGICEILVGSIVLFSMPFYSRLPYLFNQIASSLARQPQTFWVYQSSQFVICALIMLVPTIIQGITLPAATKVLTNQTTSLGKKIGLIFAVNTIGTIVGIIAAGCWGLPMLGIKGLLETAVFINILIGAIVLILAKDLSMRKISLSAGLLIVCISISWYKCGGYEWDNDVLISGVFRTYQRIPSYKELKARAKERSVIFYRDGMGATIAVQEILPERKERFLSINGKTDASLIADLPTQKMLGHVPMLIKTNVQNVLIIGIGSGATIGAVLSYDVAHVDVVEISKDIIEASKYFSAINGNYWNDPRVNIIWEDAKTFLQVTERKYDVIISEPTNPWIAGVAGVFSREYFEECAKHMVDGGLFIQWVQAYEIEDPTFYLILETFTGTFPFFTAWNPMRTDTIFAGAKQPYFPDFAHIKKTLTNHKTSEEFRLINLETVPSFLTMQMCNYAREYSHISWVGTVNSDFFPVLEYTAPRGFFVGSTANGARLLDKRYKSPVNAGLWLNEYFKLNKPSDEELEKTYHFAVKRAALFDKMPLSIANLWISQYPKSKTVQLAALREMPADYKSSTTAFLEKSKKQTLSYEERKLLCKRMFTDYLVQKSFVFLPDTQLLKKELESLINSGQNNTDWETLKWYGEICYDTGQYDDAEKSLRKALEAMEAQKAQANEFFETAVLLCETYMSNGRYEDALAHFRRYLSNSMSFSLKARILYQQLLLRMNQET